MSEKKNEKFSEKIAPEGKYRLVRIYLRENKAGIKEETDCYVIKDSAHLIELKGMKRERVEKIKKEIRDGYYDGLEIKFVIFNDKGQEIETQEIEKKFVIKRNSSPYKFRQKYLPKRKLPTNRCAFFEEIIFMAFPLMILSPFGRFFRKILIGLFKSVLLFFGRRIKSIDEYGVSLYEYKYNPKKHTKDKFALWEIIGIIVIWLNGLYCLIFNRDKLINFIFLTVKLIIVYKSYLFFVGLGLFAVILIILAITMLMPFIALGFYYLKDFKNGHCHLVDYED